MSVKETLAEFAKDHNQGCSYTESLYEIVAGYADMGCTRKEVAGVIGIIETAFLRELKKLDPEHQIKWPAGGYGESIKRRAYALYSGGANKTHISRELGVSRPTVISWFSTRAAE